MNVNASRLAVAAVAALLCFGTGESMAGQQAPQLPPRNPLTQLYAPPAAQDVSGVWWIQRYSARIQPLEGGELPFTPAGRTRYQANMQALRADPLAVDESRRNCVPDGVPRILGSPYPFQILQTPGQVTILYEINRTIRRILFDTPQAPREQLEYVPFYSGYSIGRWEGSTLVIETAGYNNKTFIDNSGVPHSAKMTTVERIQKLDPRTLEIVVTVTDPETFTRPWNARFVYDLHPEVRIEDYVCGDVHRDISHIPGVTRPN
jgi:hypothetical protein